MSLDVLIAVAGILMTVLVVVGMVLITPRGTEAAPRREVPEPEGVAPSSAAKPALP